MAESNIQWTDHTGGPWLGCTEVSTGCAHCYARELMERRLKSIVRKAYKAAGFTDWETRPVWGKTAPRVLTKGFWNSARVINRKAKTQGRAVKWFPSMIDWIDEMPAGIIDQDGNWLDVSQVLADFLALVRECEWIEWLLLTKRPENWIDRIAAAGRFANENWQWQDRYQVTDFVEGWIQNQPPANVWIGTTVENQEMADKRIPELLKIPAKVRFLSVEPMLGPVNLGDYRHSSQGEWKLDGIHWVICGGESGPGCRYFDPDWARSLRDQCQAANVAFFVKQLGGVRDHRGNLEDLPEDLRIRQFPTLSHP